MCGIAGFWKFKSDTGAALEENVRGMTETLKERGPDDHGFWVDDSCGIALGHRRLSILDLSERGHQPMTSFCGRYVIVYNGEIYNFKELKAALAEEGVSFRTECDTEVVLAAISKWGIEEALMNFNGMFAFALWDKREEKLFLARDRIGIKPLYYGVQNGILFFASELKAVRANKLFKPELDSDSLALFFRYSYIPEPHSIYKDVNKLKQGHYIAVDKELNIRQFCYWNALEKTESGIKDIIHRREEELVDELENLLTDAVGMRMISDVPLGAFLSGGIDSSIVVALMQAQSAMPVRTFTIGFHEDRYNEAVSARGVAEHLGTDHTELYVTPDELRETIPSLPNIYDEPFSDSSQVPTYLISKLTRSHVTVSLSGDGGDENFGGYNRYLWAKRVWDGTRRVPVFMRSGLSGLMKGVSPQRWDSLSERCTSFMPGIFDHRLFGDKLHKLADALTCTSPDELYSALVSHWRDPASMVLGSREPLTILQDEKVRKAIPDFVDRMMFLDLVTYLPGDILQKVDRASMAVSLEARVPLLDHRVVEFAKRLPLSVKIKDAKSKWILRKVLSRHVPEELIERPKMGFGVPIDNWLRGPLREWAEDLLDENNMKKDGILDPRPVRKIWDEHLSGRKNWQYHLWDVLMFQAWKRKWM